MSKTKPPELTKAEGISLAAVLLTIAAATLAVGGRDEGFAQADKFTNAVGFLAKADSKTVKEVGAHVAAAEKLTDKLVAGVISDAALAKQYEATLREVNQLRVNHTARALGKKAMSTSHTNSSMPISYGKSGYRGR